MSTEELGTMHTGVNCSALTVSAVGVGGRGTQVWAGAAAEDARHRKVTEREGSRWEGEGPLR